MAARSIRGAAAATLATVLALTAAACSQPGGPAGGSGSGTEDSAVVGIAYEPDSLSPLLGYGKDGNSKIFDGLLALDAGMKLRPALATALPEVSDNGLTYTYRLRKGVKFSDGEPFGAKDVVFTYRTILDKKTNNASRTELDAVKSVEAEGDDTVVFRLKYPYAPFAQRTVLPIAPEHIAGRQDVNTGDFTTRPIGTGPYLLTKWSKGEKLSFRANPGYWGGAPKVKKFTMAIIKDDDVRATRLRAGELDGAILPPNLAKGFTDGTRTYAATTYDYRTVTLPTHKAVAGDTAVRRALDIAVDRKAMVDSILNGEGLPPTDPFPPTASGSPRAPSAPTTSPPRRRSSTKPDGSPATTASAPGTAYAPPSRSGTSPATSCARTTRSPTPPTPGRPASTSPPRPVPGRSSSRG